MYTWDDPGYTDALNRTLSDLLAAIGLEMTVIKMDQAKGFEWAKANRADLIWGGLPVNSADPAAYLQPLYLPTKKRRDELERLLTRPSANGQLPRWHAGSSANRSSPST